jgi:hypothetical protein
MIAMVTTVPRERHLCEKHLPRVYVPYVYRTTPVNLHFITSEHML